MRTFFRWWICNLFHWQSWKFYADVSPRVRCNKCGREWMVFD